jgi:hypothetical protein
MSLVVAVCWVLGQVQAPQAAQPGTDLKKLGVLVGTWSVDGEIKPGNGYGQPAAKVNVVERYQWLPGEFFLEMSRQGKAGTDTVQHKWIFGYDTIAKKYMGQFFDLASGASSSATGTNNGNTWTWLSEGRSVDGKPNHERCTTTIVSAASLTVKCDTSADGKTWSPSFEAKAAKSKQ